MLRPFFMKHYECLAKKVIRVHLLQFDVYTITEYARSHVGLNSYIWTR